MDWTSIGQVVATLANVVAAGATAALVIIGRRQIIELREQIRAAGEESKLERTLNACSRYESDVVIERCVATLRRASAATGDYDCSPQNYERELKMVLNYLDGIAIGIEQGLYIENLARDHIKPIVHFYYERYMDPERARQRGIDLNHYTCLSRLAKRWLGEEIRLRVGQQPQSFGQNTPETALVS